MEKDIKLEQYVSLTRANDLLKHFELYIEETQDLLKFLAEKQLVNPMAIMDLDEWSCNLLQNIANTTKDVDKTLNELEDRVIDDRPLITTEDILKMLNESTNYEWKGGVK